MEKPDKDRRKSVEAFFKAIKTFDESAIYAIDVTNRFKKSVKRCHSRNLDLELLESLIYTLAQEDSWPKALPTSIEGI